MAVSPPPAEPMEVETQSATQAPQTRASSSTRTLDGQEQETQQVVTTPEDLAQFKWRQEYEDDLRDMALNGIMVPEWTILQNIIKSRLVYNTHAFLVKTPRVKYRPLATTTSQRNALLPATSVDSFAIDDVPSEALRPAQRADESHETPSTPGGLVIPPFPPRPSSRRQPSVAPHRPPVGDPIEIDDEAVIGGRTLKSDMEPGEAWAFLKGLFKLLDEFTTAPPFTIQRLCELAWKPFQQHTSIGKYLRAIEKNLLVTTTYDVGGQDGENGEPLQGGFSGGLNGSLGPRSRASSVSSSSSTSSQNIPLFSPIPFLVERRIINPDGTPVSSPATLPDATASSDTDVPTSALSLNLNITARQTGTEDVAMDGTDGGRPGTPMHNVSQESMFLAGAGGTRSGDKPDDGPLNHLALSTSAVAVLAAQTNGNGTSNGHETSASSAGSDSSGSTSDKAHEPFTGRVDELDAGPLLHHATSGTASDPHQLHLAPDATTTTGVAHHQEGTGERGTMTPHAMSDRPQAISSTTDLNAVVVHGDKEMDAPPPPPAGPGGARVIRGMPRTLSVASSLNDRFVSGEILEANVPEERGAGAEDEPATSL